MSERSQLDLSEMAFSILAEKPLGYILQTLQPLSGLLIEPVSVTAWSRHGRRDERRRHHAVNAGVIPDCRQIAFCGKRSVAGRGQNVGQADADIRSHAGQHSLAHSRATSYSQDKSQLLQIQYP